MTPDAHRRLRPRTAVRVAFAVVTSAVAGGAFGCGAGATSGPKAAAPDGAQAASGADGEAARDEEDAAPPNTTGEGLLGALAAEGAHVAPGMHNSLSDELDVAGRHERVVVETPAEDTCVRVVYRATVPTRGWLTLGDGTELADAGGARERGVLGERGPVCVRKGQTLKLALEPTGDARVGFCVFTASASSIERGAPRAPSAPAATRSAPTR